MKKILEIDEEVLKPFLLSYNEMKSNILMKLKESNKDYKNILKEKEQILDKFPNLRNIIEFDSIKGDKETGVILALSDKYYDQIIPAFRKENYKNYFKIQRRI